ncbi:MAG TPA: PilZ domain-containing protein [Terracidiphilus sp.]
MSLIANYAAKIGLRERRKNGRMPTRGIEAAYSVDENQKDATIRDISPTGVCLASEDQLAVGSDVLVTLRRKPLDESDYGTEVSMPARVVRAGTKEVGLEFLHQHLDATAWSNLVLKAAEISKGKDGVRVFRVARALAFLQRISPATEPQFVKAITGAMSNDGAERALEIVVRAEGMVWQNGRGPRAGVDARLVYRIVERGANTDLCEAEMMGFWAGLLAAAAHEGVREQDCLESADMVSKLELSHLRILAAGCERAVSLGWGAGYELPQRVYYSATEIRKNTGARDMTAVERGLNRLEELGLLQKSQKLPIFEPVTEVDVTPTALGLNLYARCIGRTRMPEVHIAGSKLEPETADAESEPEKESGQAPAWRGFRGARPWPGMSAG